LYNRKVRVPAAKDGGHAPAPAAPSKP
jgi:hypothetical protein